MATPRVQFTATLLLDGRVLVAGGRSGLGGDDYLASAELFDPKTGTFSSTGSMSQPRARHTATLLNDGRVLLTGGEQWGSTGTAYTATAELFDPSSGKFVFTASMNDARSWHTASLLSDGTVLVVAGIAKTTLATAELFDPLTGTFKRVGSMSQARYDHAVVTLTNGNVLVAGGPGISGIESYVTTASAFTGAGSMTVSRESFGVALLPSGEVLFVGGYRNDSSYLGPVSSAEVCVVSQGTCRPTGSMSMVRNSFTTTVLASSKVLVAGGVGGPDTRYSGTLTLAELYDPAAGAFLSTGSLQVPRDGHAAVLLQSGAVLVVGGWNNHVNAGNASAEVFR